MSEAIVDTHQHFWDLGRFHYSWMTPEREALRRNFLPEDLLPLLTQAGVERTVLVQAHPSLAESRWLLELASANHFIAGVVVWIDLTSPDLARELDAFQRHPKFKGVRHQIEAEPDDDWMTRREVQIGFAELERRGIPYDLVIFPRHLKYIPVLRERCPDLKLVLDHIAKPDIAQGKMEEWACEIESVAKLPHLWCKLSGMVTEANLNTWTPDDLKPYVEHVVKQFGYGGLMFGSDWPVCTLAGSYEQVLEGLRQAVGPLREQDAAKVWGGNAREFYMLT